MKENKSHHGMERIVQWFFGAILFFLIVFSYGYFTHSKKIFPYQVIKAAREGLKEIEHPTPWYYQPTDLSNSVSSLKEQSSQALTLLSYIDKDQKLAVEIIDLEGNEVHKWQPDWFDLWQDDASHIPAELLPNSPPGTHIHGVVLMNNGDLVFNFDYFGLVRMNLCGDVVWKIPLMTHHSIYQDENENLWVCGQTVNREHNGNVVHRPYYSEELILKVSPSGEVLRQISVDKVLKENNLNGLLHLSILMDGEKTTTGDVLHMNDIESFSSEMEPGYFEPGDIMISLRNINTILVFNEENLRVKALSVGEVVKQHDPDFIDGNTISIFDNNMVASSEDNPQSKIVIKSFIGDKPLTSYYQGSAQDPFYTAELGKHQWLENGNLLVTSPFEARAFELDSALNKVWEYTNVLGNGYTGMISEAQRLPGSFSAEFFKQNAKRCN